MKACVYQASTEINYLTKLYKYPEYTFPKTASLENHLKRNILKDNFPLGFRPDFCNYSLKSSIMKYLLLPFFIALPFLSQAQFAMNYSYVFNAPQNYMRSSLSNAHGFAMEYYGNVKKTNYQIGLAYHMGIYGYHTEPIDFTASDGSIVKTNLNISNAFNFISIYHKYSFNKFATSGRLIPFIDAKTGWSFFRTKLYIADPEDVSNCEPLEQDIMQRDNTWNLYGGAGFDYRLNGIFNPANDDCLMKSYFFVSFGFQYGGKVSYMNVDKDDEVTAAHNHTSDDPNKTEFYTTWVNTQTRIEHEHHTGYLFSSPIRMMQIKAGFSLRF